MNKVNSTSIVIVDFGKMSQCRKSLFWQSSNSSKKLLCFSYGMQLSKMIMSFIFEIKLHIFCHSWEVSVLELFHGCHLSVETLGKSKVFFPHVIEKTKNPFERLQKVEINNSN